MYSAVAQLDRASVYGTEGCRFKSYLRSHTQIIHKQKMPFKKPLNSIFFGGFTYYENVHLPKKSVQIVKKPPKTAKNKGLDRLQSGYSIYT